MNIEPNNDPVMAASTIPDTSSAERPHITICICTFRRQELLSRLLDNILLLNGIGTEFTCSCVVVDNDAAGSAREIAAKFSRERTLRLVYDIEPLRNFAIVRNRAVSLARGEFIAFIDDDEYPEKEWLSNLLGTLRRFGADGVLGPVRPYYETKPAKWVIKGRLCDRPAHPTGMVMEWSQSRTGNVLLSASVISTGQMLFDPLFATGGEDVDFFKRASKAGYRFVWCEEAPAYELVPPERLTASYFLKRGILQGQISLRYASDRLTILSRSKIAVHSAIALCVYAALLPFLLIFQLHQAMRFLIKCCHHLGRLFAASGCPLMKRRSF